MDRFFGGMFASGPEPQPPPVWARFFAPREYQRFLARVEQHFRKRKQTYRFDDGIVHVQASEDGERHQFGLQNLAQLCHQVPEKEWDAVIAGHFRTVERGWREQAVLNERLHSFERVQDLLMVRLWPREFLEGMDTQRLLFREDLAGTVSVLVYDMPSAIQNVNAADAQAWDQDRDTLFEKGLDNVLENCIPDRSLQPLDEEVSITVFSDESFFVASHALLLDRHDQCVGTYGALVGIPHRHVLLCYPIEDIAVIRAVNLMIPIILGMENEGPGSISPMLYWYRDRQFVELPYRIEGNVLQFGPPPEFIDMLNGFAE